MKLQKVGEYVHYLEIVDRYKRKGCLSNDYIYREVADMIIHDRLYEYCGKNNAFLFVKKDECLQVYYYLNDLTELFDFDVDNDLVVEILFRRSIGTPENEMDYLGKCGFCPNLCRDQYGGLYKDLLASCPISNVIVRRAQSIEEIKLARLLFSRTFDHYSGDYIPEQMIKKLYENDCIWIALDENSQFAGALHQTIIGHVAWVSHVAVIEGFRGRGIGQALLDTFIEQNRTDDNSRYMLWVQTQNKAAVKMYQKKGLKYMNKSTMSMLKLK